MIKTKVEIINLAKKTLQQEADAIAELQDLITDDFSDAVNAILTIKGRVLITGIGKSAIIAQKIVATMNSTGTPATFMHAADAIHGDLGTLQPEDITICISKSGDTPEIKVLVPLLKRNGNKLIAIVGNTSSFLALQADYILNAFVKKEACPNNLAPTSSTTAQLAIGDALAVCLLDAKKFKDVDFAKYHPGGALGKKLYLTAGELAAQHLQPQVKPSDSLKKVIVEISTKRLGATAVIENNQLVGVITDGDIRRMLEKETNIETITARDLMNKSPKKIESDALATNALQLLEKHNITQLVVCESDSYSGFVHLHDLIKEGII